MDILDEQIATMVIEQADICPAKEAVNGYIKLIDRAKHPQDKKSFVNITTIDLKLNEEKLTPFIRDIIENYTERLSVDRINEVYRKGKYKELAAKKSLINDLAEANPGEMLYKVVLFENSLTIHSYDESSNVLLERLRNWFVIDIPEADKHDVIFIDKSTLDPNVYDFILALLIDYKSPNPFSIILDEGFVEVHNFGWFTHIETNPSDELLRVLHLLMNPETNLRIPYSLIRDQTIALGIETRHPDLYYMALVNTDEANKEIIPVATKETDTFDKALKSYIFDWIAFSKKTTIYINNNSIEFILITEDLEFYVINVRASGEFHHTQLTTLDDTFTHEYRLFDI